MVNCDYPSLTDPAYVTENKERCWACGRLLKPADKLGDTCNRCALVAVFENTFNQIQKEIK